MCSVKGFGCLLLHFIWSGKFGEPIPTYHVYVAWMCFVTCVCMCVCVCMRVLVRARGRVCVLHCT